MRTDCEILSDSLILIGCGGHARSVASVYLSAHPKAHLLFIDKMARADEKILGFPVLPEPNGNCGPFFLAIGDNQKRKILWDEWSEKNLFSIVSPSALICPHAKIGRNVFVGNFAHIGPETRIGHNTIINTGAIVEHEVVVGDHCHIGPRAVISGRSKIGSFTFIGVGAVVKDSINISSNIIVGAGAVVVKDLTEPGVYVGCPARRSFF